MVVARPYLSAYLAGTGIGLVLIASFALTGRGLGASGAYSSAVTAAVAAAAPGHVSANPSYDGYTGRPLDDWLVVEVIGIAAGGLLSAVLAGRLRVGLERGPRTGRATRLLTAMAAGAAMGVGAKLARGCTSGLGLSGGAVLSVGSWLFIACAFAAGYAMLPLCRRLWS